MTRGKRPDDVIGDVPRERISTRLMSAKEKLASSDLDSRVRVHRYPSGHVVGEILVLVPRGVTAQKVALELEHALGYTSMSGYWISSGARYRIPDTATDDERSRYAVRRGAHDIPTHPQRATRTNFGEVQLVSRQIISPGAERTLGRKTGELYFRIFWSPDKKRPKRKR